ncbi:MAG: hypothetical protein DDT21_00112 [Syntrophomonadaceae bacterium]|nr:hypothetical protein [Bacillota bacterium]
MKEVRATMLDRLLLKAIASRLAAGGDCPADPHCIHVAADGCQASADALRERKARIVSKRIQEETRKPCKAFMETGSGKQWPCTGRVWTILLPPEHVGQD